MKKFKMLFLAVVCFISGIVVCFEWLGHDKGQRIYTMLKRPEVVEKRVEIIVYKPVVCSDDAKILLVNQEYRDALLITSKTRSKYNSNSDMAKEFSKIINMANEALDRAERIIVKENN